MAFCSKCGAQLDGALKFCTACGTPTTPQQAQPPQYQQAQPMQASPQYQQPYAPAPAPPPVPAKKKSKAPLVIVVLVVVGGLAAAGIFTNGFGLFGGKGGAIPVSMIMGSNAALTQSGKSAQAAQEGAELTAGSRLTTGAETSVYLKIDEDSIIKMNENSEISVTEISNSVLKFELVRGSVLINEKDKDGRLHMTAGNSYLIVRGTFFTAKFDGGSMVVDLIEGKIDVTADSGSVTNVEQGNRVTVRGNDDAVVETLDVSNFDAFTMDSVMEYKDALTRGSLTEQDFSYITDYLGGGPIYDGIIPEDWPIYDDSATGDLGDGGGSDGGDNGDGGGLDYYPEDWVSPGGGGSDGDSLPDTWLV